MKDLRIIYQNNRPYGIRDEGGFLFFFAKIQKYSNQEERYRQEVEQQYQLADKLLGFLRSQSKVDSTIPQHGQLAIALMDKLQEVTIRCGDLDECHADIIGILNEWRSATASE
jgi:hypothetical protein